MRRSEAGLEQDRAAHGGNYRQRIYNKYRSGRPQAAMSTPSVILNSRAAHLRKLIREHFPPERDAAVLDLGCGDGALIYFLKEAGYRNVVGVDCSVEQVAAARQLGIEGVVLGEADAYLESVPSASYDVVGTFDVLEHFSKAEALWLGEQVYRVLKAGGKWLVHAPNGESPFAGRMRYGDLTHEQAFTVESLTQLAMSCGFSSVSCFEDSPVPHGVKSVVRWVLWRFIRGVLRAYIAVETGDMGKRCIFSQNLIAVAVK